MAVNKVNFGGTTLIDLESDTVDTANLVSGKTAHDRTGEVITGTLVINKYYTGSSTPSASLGNDGDIYFKVT